MPHFLDYHFTDSTEFVATFDELPLWSAPFGLLMLKHLELRAGLTVLDVGSGAGFPLLELAQRLGASSTCYGLDPWTNANERARQKVKNYEVNNVHIIDGSASGIPFESDTIDLTVSNLGINNFADPAAVFTECYRVLKPGGRLVLTTNRDGHWREFYKVFEQTLRQLDMQGALEKLNIHERHRGTVSTVSGLFTDAGFNLTRNFEEQFEMRFLDGSAMLNHSFIKLGWLSGWKEIVPEASQVQVFTTLENNLNDYAHTNGGLVLTVPMAYIEGIK